MVDIRFSVPGLPAPGGSKKAFWRSGMKHANIVDAGGEKTKNWRAVVALAARQAYQGPPLSGPLAIRVEFVMPRPKGHYGSGKNASRLKESAPQWPTTKPDATKLLRSTEDALTGICWVDDSQIVRQDVAKNYAHATLPVGANITVIPMIALAPPVPEGDGGRGR